MDLADEDTIVGPGAEDAVDDPARESDDLAGPDLGALASVWTWTEHEPRA